MYAVLDTSTLISLARSGQLPLLQSAPFTPVILDVVHDEAVRAGLAHGHPDAAAIETALRPYEITRTASTEAADDVVLVETTRTGLLVANDLALGRRARNLGAAWLRTADMVVWMRRDGRIPRTAAVAAVEALRHAGRMHTSLADRYLEEM